MKAGLLLFCRIMAGTCYLLGVKYNIKFSSQADKVREGSREGEKNFPTGGNVQVCAREFPGEG